MGNIYVGFDLGGTKCAAVIAEVKRGGKINFLGRHQVNTEHRGKPSPWKSIMDRLISFIKDSEYVKDPKDIKGCGISCGGPLDSKRGVILNPPNLMSFENAPIVDYVHKRLGCPVRLQNDADACALAEWKFGAGRGTNNMIFLTFGTGIGAGLILDGKLYVGASNLAGEVGHIRLDPDGPDMPEGYRKRGSFEGFCSGGGIRQLIKLRTGKDLEPKDLDRLADAGDQQAIDIQNEIGEHLGRGLAILVDLLNPEVIVIGSIFVRAERHLRGPALRVLEEEALPESFRGFELRPAELGEQIGDYAAIAIGMG